MTSSAVSACSAASNPPSGKLLVTSAGEHKLYDLDDRLDDGPNLLEGELEPEAKAAYSRLRRHHDEIQAGLTYDVR